MSEWIAFKDRAPKVGQWVLVCRCGGDGWAENWPERGDMDGRVTHWQPFPEPPPKPDPFEEWWGDPKCGWKLIAGYHVPKCEAQVIFTAGLEAGRKEK